MIKKLFISTLIILLTALTGCTKTIQPGDYDSSEVGKIKKVAPGTIISKRPVKIHNKTTENATAANPTTSDDTNFDATRSHGFEYVIKLNNGAIISVVQTEDLDLKAKQHVLVIYGDNTRVVADEGSDD